MEIKGGLFTVMSSVFVSRVPKELATRCCSNFRVKRPAITYFREMSWVVFPLKSSLVVLASFGVPAVSPKFDERGKCEKFVTGSCEKEI